MQRSAFPCSNTGTAPGSAVFLLQSPQEDRNSRRAGISRNYTRFRFPYPLSFASLPIVTSRETASCAGITLGPPTSGRHASNDFSLQLWVFSIDCRKLKRRSGPGVEGERITLRLWNDLWPENELRFFETFGEQNTAFNCDKFLSPYVV